MRRTKLEQKLAILRACMVPLKLTHLMYRTNLNCVVLKEFVGELLDRKLLTEKVIGRRTVFRTSAKGYELLKQWRQLETVVGV